MELSLQKRLAADVLKASKKRVKIDLQMLDNLGLSIDDLKRSITKQDIRGYIGKGVIYSIQKKGVSRVMARKRQKQRAKGRQRGPGTRKGSKNARLPRKEEWMNKIRIQRNLLKALREKNVISKENFWELYRKAKGGFFRSKRHIHIFMEEHGMVKSAIKK